MAKSEGNFLTLTDLKKSGYSPLAFRYLVLGTHYRKKINFSWENLQAAQTALERIYTGLNNLTAAVAEAKLETKNPTVEKDGENIKTLKEIEDAFQEAISDDLNTAKAVVLLREIVFGDYGNFTQRVNLVKKFDEVLGVGLNEVIQSYSYEKDQQIAQKIVEYQQFRASKQFVQSDALRKEIEDLGYEVRDTENGPQVVKKFF